jgi:ABC-type spermidine/putrescine transport system permease subunit II
VSLATVDVTASDRNARVGPPPRNAFWGRALGGGPTLVLLGLAVAPLVTMFLTSVTPAVGVAGHQWLSAAGYVHALAAGRLRMTLLVTLRAAEIATVDIIVALPVAVLLAKMSRRWQWIAVFSLSLPFVVGESIRTFGWRSVFNYIDPSATIFLVGDRAVIVALIAATLPFAVFPILLSLPRRSDSIWMCMGDMGIGPIKGLLRVWLPITLPSVGFSWLGVFALALGASTEASILARPMEIRIRALIKDLERSKDYAAVAALGTTSLVLIVLIGVASHVLIRVIPRWRARRRHRIDSDIRALAIREPLRLPDESSSRARRWWQVLGRALLVAIVGVELCPVIAVLVLSVARTTGGSAYSDLGGPSGPVDAVRGSLCVAACVGIGNVVLAGLCGVAWWHRTWRWVVTIGLAGLAFLPSDSHALAVSKMFQFAGGRQAELGWVVMAHLGWAVPFGTAVIFASNAQIDPQILGAAREMGASRWYVWSRLVLKPSWVALVNCFVIGALLSINEYGRSFHLHGAREMLSIYLYGRMASGTDASVYAIGGIAVALSVCAACLVATLIRVASLRPNQPAGTSAGAGPIA